MKKCEYYHLLLVVVLIVIGCARKRSDDDQYGGAVPQWAAVEARMTQSAYGSANVEQAIKILENLISNLEVRAGSSTPEYAITDGIWVNKIRLAGALYAKGDTSRASEMIDNIARTRTKHVLNSQELASKKTKIFEWLIHEYSIRNPSWGKEAILKFRECIINMDKRGEDG